MRLSFELPAALWLLAVPALLLLLARRAHSARRETTGTLPFWRTAADSAAPRGQRAARRWPAGLLLLCAALVAGVFALAGPRTGAPAKRLHHFVLDRSPSMFLPLIEGGAPRIERVLERVRKHLDQRLRRGDEVRWSTWDGEGFVEVAGRTPPPAWVLRPSVRASAPPWELVDLAGTTWVTDVMPPVDRERAGVCASGASPVPGPITAHAGTETVWDAGQLVPRATPGQRTIALAGELPAVVADLVQVWATARGLELAAGSPEAALTVTGPRGLPGESADAGREAWSASGPAALLSAAGPDLVQRRTWLAASDGRTLVSWWPGRVDVAWSDPLELRGEPAAFAVSWSRLLDRALPAPAGVVALGERASAGPARWEPALEGVPLKRDERQIWAPWLAALTCLLALAATRYAA